MLNNSGKFRRGTTYLVKYPTLPNITEKPNTIEIHQSMGSHDVLTLRYRSTSQSVFKKLKTGVPLQVVINQGILTKTFYAYVSHVSKETSGQKKNELKIQCVGSSFPLKARTTRVFKKKTLPEIARIIAKEHGLKIVTDNHTTRFNQLAISGQSYWQWLQEHAKKIGYGVQMDGLTLYFRPLDKLIDQTMTNVPIMSMFSSVIPKNIMYLDRTLDYFEVLSGENIEQDNVLRTNKQVGGVDPLTSKSFTSKTSPKTKGKKLRKKVSDVLFDEYVHHQVVNDKSAAKMSSEGQAQLARLNLPANARGQGDPRIKPWAPIYVTGTGEETDGHWVVNSVIHSLSALGAYQVELLVTTDGLGTLAASRTIPNTIGLVDIESALKNKHVRNAARDVKLTSKSGLFTESDQGFNRTPVLWKSNSEGPRRVC